MTTHVVTCFLRNRGRILLTRRPDSAPTYPGRWAGVSGLIEPDESPEETAYREIAEETGLDGAVDLVETGGTVTVTDGDREWLAHPFMLDCQTRDLAESREHVDRAWVHAPAILRRDTVPGLWRVYHRVAPTVRSVAADTEHGSGYVSVRALEVLRDRAGLVTVREGNDPNDWDELADLARRLRTARPSMAALGNRIDRVMARADRIPGAVERRAAAAVDAAVDADIGAAEAVVPRIEGCRVLTLSRSGTVLAALRRAAPAAVYVGESRPASEGVGVAEELADELTVILHTDAAIAHLLARADLDAVVVGADTVRADGGIINKTGTRGAAVAAAREDVTFLCVAAVDKISPAPPQLESGPGSAVYDGPAPVEVANPTFDETPPDLVDGIATERGILSPSAVSDVADELRALSAWDRSATEK